MKSVTKGEASETIAASVSEVFITRMRPIRSDRMLAGMSNNASAAVPAETDKLALAGLMSNASHSKGRMGCVP